MGGYYESERKICRAAKILSVITAVIFVFVLGTFIKDINEYNNYQGETMAIIYDVNTRIVHVKADSYYEYKAFYKYVVNDTPYGGESSWMNNIPAIYKGQQAKIKFDLKSPGSSTLEMDKDSSVSGFWTVVMTGNIAVIFTILTFTGKKKEE